MYKMQICKMPFNILEFEKLVTVCSYIPFIYRIKMCNKSKNNAYDLIQFEWFGLSAFWCD